MSASHSLAVPHARIDTDRLRLNHPIADLIGRYGIELRRSGSTLVGRCPFHQDGGRPKLNRLSSLWSVCVLPLPGARRRHTTRCI